MSLGLIAASSFNQAALEVAVVIGDLTRSFQGLKFYDDFNRSNRGFPDNGWLAGTNTGTGSFTIVDNRVLHLGAGRSTLWQTIGTEATNGIYQINLSMDPASNQEPGLAIRVNDPTGTVGNRYHVSIDTFVTPNDSLWTQPNVETINRIDMPNDLSADEPTGWRCITSQSGNRIDLITAVTGALADLTVMDQPFTTVASGVSDDPALGVADFGLVARGTCSFDGYFHCEGHLIKMFGMNTGEKMRVIGPITHSSVTETGGTASLDVTNLALPMSRVELLDSSDVILKAFTSASGIWTDEFDASL